MEIEKKFLVKELPENLDNYDVYQLEQGYLCSYPTVRIRKCDEDYSLTYKSKGTSRKGCKNVIVNNEVELELNENSYETLKAKIDGKLVVKDRYAIPIQDNLVAEMDIFKEHLEATILSPSKCSLKISISATKLSCIGIAYLSFTTNLPSILALRVS